MPIIGYVGKDVTFTVDATPYNCVLSSVGLSVTPTTATITALCADADKDELVGTTYAYELTYNVDWATGSFHRFLRENHGVTVDVDLVPDPVGNPTVHETGSGQLIDAGYAITKGAAVQGTARVLLVDAPVIAP